MDRPVDERGSPKKDSRFPELNKLLREAPNLGRSGRPNILVSRLNQRQRDIVLGLIIVFDSSTLSAAETPALDIASDLRAAARLAGDLTKVLNRVLSYKGMTQVLDEMKQLPPYLAIAETTCTELAALFGKPGYEESNLTNVFLVAASEFVKLSLGKYWDEDVAQVLEVAQASRPGKRIEHSEAEEGDNLITEDVVRKKRNYLKANVRGFYALAKRTALQLSKAKS
jgi:hypothetical protein